MITEDQLREALKRCTDEDTKPLGDEVPWPGLATSEPMRWPEWFHHGLGFLIGVDHRRSGVKWLAVEDHESGVRNGWLAQHLEYLRWVHRDDDSCPTCFGEPVEGEGPLIPGRLDLSQWTCEDGHCWHRCPAHGAKVAGEYDYDKQPACTCGATEKEPLRGVDLKTGDYVLATKYEDGDPGDHWAIGFLAGLETQGRYRIEDGSGKPFRHNGFRRAAKISKELGRWILDRREEIEESDRDLWAWAVIGESETEKEGKS